MRFTLRTPERSHGIRVIEEIPDVRLCRIEGQNGIGKTLALRLLELCTGTQSYAHQPDAWRTLCAYLGPTVIEVEGLRSESREGSHTIRWTFDWGERAELPPPLEVTDDLFAEITLDGSAISMADVRRWLRLIRVAGNETVEETIAGLVTIDLQLLQQADGLLSKHRLYADQRLNELLSPVPVAAAKDCIDLEERRVQQSRNLEETKNELAEARDRRSALEAAAAVASAVQDVEANASELETRLAHAREAFEAARTEADEAEAERDATKAKVASSSEIAKELKRLDNLLRRRLTRYERVRGAVDEAAASLQIEPKGEVISTARAEVAARRDRIARERADLADVAGVRDLLDELVSALAPAATSTLSERTALTINDQDITVGALLVAVRDQRERLSREVPELEDLDRELGELQERDDSLSALETLLADFSQAEERVTEAQDELDQLKDVDPSADTEAAQDAARKYAAAQRALIDLGAEVGALERQRSRLGGGLSVEDLRADRDRKLQEAGATEEQLPDAVTQAQERVVALSAERDRLTTVLKDVRAALDDAYDLVTDATERLHTDNNYADLRELAGEFAPQPSTEVPTMAEAWLRLQRANEEAVEQLQRLRQPLLRTLESVGALAGVARRTVEPAPELDAIRRFYEPEFVRLFSSDELATALFDGGELTRIDLYEGEMRWTTPSGEARVRPFQAFSSGERAFAYATARLSGTRQIEAFNKVVAVDEFGAFLSRDRLIRLQELVAGQLSAGLVDQVIVVLPLGSFPEPIDAEGERNLAELKERGYFADRFEAVAMAS